MPLTFFMLSGETSGDMHAAKLISALAAREPGARFVGMGGPAMRAAGLEVAKDLEGMQVVGFWEVARKFGFFKRVFEALLDRLKQERPDALICVDYPGFNLRFAAEVKKLGIPVLYYIVPQVWAWKPGRVKEMARIVDRAFCVFDFEPPFFEPYGLKTEFVGHPLVDATPPLETPRAPPPVAPSDAPLIAFLPGSRQGELRHHCAPLCDAFSIVRKERPDARAIFSIPAGTPREQQRFVEQRLSGDASARNAPETRTGCTEQPAVVSSHAGAVQLAAGSHATALPAAADFSVVKSGTSTLEAGLVGKPMCVVYRSSVISYFIAHQLVNIPVFSLVNIVLGRYAVPELAQNDVAGPRIAAEIAHGLDDTDYRARQMAALAELPKKLGGPGASARAAAGMLAFLRGK